MTESAGVIFNEQLNSNKNTTLTLPQARVCLFGKLKKNGNNSSCAENTEHSGFLKQIQNIIENECNIVPFL